MFPKRFYLLHTVGLRKYRHITKTKSHTYIIAYNLVNFGQYTKKTDTDVVTDEVFGITLRIRISW